MRREIKGTVRDYVLDCCHLVIVDEEGEKLHDVLREFEDKKVKVTIELIK